MSKARTRQGSGASRSNAARAGTNAKGRRTTGGAANGVRQAAGGGKLQSGGAGQRNGAAQRGSASAGRGPAGQPKGSGGAARRPAGSTAKPAAGTPAGGQPTGGNRWLLGMTGVEASTLILSIIGLGVSVYATLLHYDSNIKPFCSASGAIDCQAVMTSAQSVVFNVFPVAVLGMAFFLFMIAINSPWAWRAKFPAIFDRVGGRALAARPELIGWTRLGTIIVGMGFAIYLIYAELVQIGKICLWCSSVHLITFLLFIIIVFHASFSWNRSDAARAT
jgi:uncharacterized membrane protein